MNKSNKKNNSISIQQGSRLFNKTSLLLCLLTGFLLLPFINKPFHIDDTLFVRLAEHIAEDPFAPYQFEYTWFLQPMPFWKVTQNPPLNSYILALPGSILGMNEIVLHSVGICFAIGCCLLMYRIASRLTKQPAIPTLFMIACPGFLVSATNVMADIPLLFFWLLSIELTISATEEKQSHKLWYAGLSIAAAALTKYFGIALLPLLIVYWLIKTGKPSFRLLALLIPVTTIFSLWGIYSIANGTIFHPYGAASYSVRNRSVIELFKNISQTITFLGGSLLWPLFVLPLFFKQSKRLFTISLIIGVFTIFLAIDIWGINTGIHFGLMFFAGLGVILIASNFIYKNFNAENILLLLWFAGTIIFSAILNWTVNSRVLLIALFPLGILFTRWLESKGDIEQPKRIHIAITATLLISLFVSWGDMQHAKTSRNFAQTYVRDKIKEGKNVSFCGHWGFQYYMEQEGATALDYSRISLKNGDLLIYPAQNTNINLVQMPGKRIDIKTYPAGKVGPFTINGQMNAGFYSSIWGPIPFIFKTGGNYDQFTVDEFDEKSKTILNKPY